MILKIMNRKLKIEEDLISEMVKYKQDAPSDYEQGGMLIGSMIKGTRDIIIDRLTFPLKVDIYDRFRFIRSIKHNIILLRIWRESENTSMYVGEWHTHPQKTPEPSDQDRKNWINICKNATSDIDIFVFIIIGIEEIGVWFMEKKNNKILKVAIDE